MKTWRVVAGSQVEGLKLSDETPGKLGPTQVGCACALHP